VISTSSNNLFSKGFLHKELRDPDSPL